MLFPAADSVRRNKIVPWSRRFDLLLVKEIGPSRSNRGSLPCSGLIFLFAHEGDVKGDCPFLQEEGPLPDQEEDFAVGQEIHNAFLSKKLIPSLIKTTSPARCITIFVRLEKSVFLYHQEELLLELGEGLLNQDEYCFLEQREPLMTISGWTDCTFDISRLIFLKSKSFVTC